MKNCYRLFLPAFGAASIALLFVPNAIAQCGGIRPAAVTHASLQPQTAQARLLRAAYSPAAMQDQEDEAASASIVGFWHVKFIAEGDKTIPNGTEIDAGYSQWHSDGTEIMNSGGRAPDTSNFCLGVWEKVGPSQYKLNHLAAAWDPTKNVLLGPANIKEEVTLAPTGEHFAGSFTINQFDESGNLLAHVVGKITGDRISVNTPPTSIF